MYQTFNFAFSASLRINMINTRMKKKKKSNQIYGVLKAYTTYDKM